MMTCLLTCLLTSMLVFTVTSIDEIVTNEFVKLEVILNESLMQAADKNFRFFIFAGMQF